MIYKKYNLGDYEQVMELANKGYSNQQISKIINVNDSTVWSWVDRKSKPHIISDQYRERNILSEECKKIDINVAYVLGVVYGDGSIIEQRKQVKLNTIDKEFISYFKKVIEKWGGIKGSKITFFAKKKKEYFYYFTCGGAVRFLKNIDRRDMVDYDESVKSSFLKGFFDSEGTATKEPKRCVGVFNIDLELLKLVNVLLNDIGIKTRTIRKRKKLGGYNKHFIYELYLQTSKENLNKFREKINFTIKRKAQRLKNYYKNGKN